MTTSPRKVNRKVHEGAHVYSQDKVQRRDEEIEINEISLANTMASKDTMMIHTLDTYVADTTMKNTFRTYDIANFADFQATSAIFGLSLF